MNKLIYIFLIGVFVFGCAHHSKNSEDITVLPVSKVKWQKLNPARGDKSPQAGTLWGDRKGISATGFLAKFVDRFSSPPHIHNVSYRAIVIKGMIHNDDPKAAKMWMPKGSYWTQPAGEAHITSAKGKINIALVEIDKAPYLVRPVKKKFDNGERPYNIHASNIIWKNNGNYELAPIWKNESGKVTGHLLKFSEAINLRSENSKLVLIQGNLSFESQILEPGSLISVNKQSKVNLNCESRNCILYLKSERMLEVE